MAIWNRNDFNEDIESEEFLLLFEKSVGFDVCW